jgi:uncharacterized spore protein YtfJ
MVTMLQTCRSTVRAPVRGSVQEELTMDVQQVLRTARELLSAERAFGPPFERDGVTVLPVARLRVRGGGGQGDGPDGTGFGGGVMGGAEPLGVYEISGGHVRWRPALDVNRLVLGGQLVVIVALLTWRSVARAIR